MGRSSVVTSWCWWDKRMVVLAGMPQTAMSFFPMALSTEDHDE
jgi:hypothetical protein